MRPRLTPAGGPADGSKSVAHALALRYDPMLSVSVALFRNRKLHERLSPRDYGLLERCLEDPVDLDELVVDAAALAWLLFYGLVKVHVDARDTVWCRTTPLGSEVWKDRNRPRHEP